GAFLKRGRSFQRDRDLLRDALAGRGQARLEQIVLRREVVEQGLLAHADRLRDPLERRARIPFAPELSDGLTDDRGPTPLATRPRHALLPGLRPAAPRHRARSLPRAAPRGSDRPGEPRRLVLLA